MPDKSKEIEMLKLRIRIAEAEKQKAMTTSNNSPKPKETNVPKKDMFESKKVDYSNMHQSAPTSSTDNKNYLEKQKKDSITANIESFLSGAVNSATLGIAPLIGEAILQSPKMIKGDFKKEDLFEGTKQSRLKHKDEAPLANTIGTLAGYISPGGATSIIGKGVVKGGGKVLAKKAGEGIVKKIGKTVARELGEAAVASTIEEVVKGETDIKNIGKTALTDAALSTLMLGTGKTLSKGGELSGKGVKGVVNKFTEMLPAHWTKSKKVAADNIIKKTILKSNKTISDIDKNLFNFNKYKLHDVDINKISNKTSLKIRNAKENLNNIVENSNELLPTRDINDILNGIKNETINNPTKYANSEAVNETLDEIQSMYKKLGSSENISMEETLKLKRWVQKNINFNRDNINKTTESINKEKIFEKFRKALDDKLGSKLGNDYKKANKVMSDLIPIQESIKKFQTSIAKQGDKAAKPFKLFSHDFFIDQTKDVKLAKELMENVPPVKNPFKDKTIKDFYDNIVKNYKKTINKSKRKDEIKKLKDLIYDPSASNYGIYKTMANKIREDENK